MRPNGDHKVTQPSRVDTQLPLTALTRHRHQIWTIAMTLLDDPDAAAAAMGTALATPSTDLPGTPVAQLIQTMMRLCLSQPLPAEHTVGEPSIQMVLVAAFASLESDQQLAVALIDLARMSVSESAQLLGRPAAEVASQRTRGLHQMTRRLRNDPSLYSEQPALHHHNSVAVPTQRSIEPVTTGAVPR